MRTILLLLLSAITQLTSAQQLPWNFIILKDEATRIYDTKTLDSLPNWYAVYCNEQKNIGRYYVKKLPLKIIAKEDDLPFADQDSFYTIEKKDTLRAQFLIGTSTNLDKLLLYDNMCGSYERYYKKNGLMIPGQRVGDSFSTLSCPTLELVGSGEYSCVFDSLIQIRKYAIKALFHNTHSGPDTTYTISFNQANGLYPYQTPSHYFPQVFWMGDLDHDRKTDFILYFKQHFYLYLTVYADKKEYAKLIGISPHLNSWAME